MFRILLLSTVLLTSSAYAVQLFILPPDRRNEELGKAFGQGLAIRMRELEIRKQNELAMQRIRKQIEIAEQKKRQEAANEKIYQMARRDGS